VLNLSHLGRACAAIAVLAFSTPPMQAQSDTTAFDVVSIKPNRSGDGGMSFQMLPGGRFVAINATVRALLQSTYQFKYFPWQVVGGPDWIDREHFDIEGRAGTPASINQIQAMVRTLLATRFKLAYTEETREQSIYHLVTARGDGRPGPQLTQPATPCDATPVPLDAPPPVPTADGPRRCGARFTRGTTGQRIEGIGVPIDEIARRLTQPLRRIVVNRTRLEGTFDFGLEYTPESERDAAGDASVPLLTALQDQLGLRVESARGPVEVLVIQSAEKPEEN
jgi:uncharacterized protein (TIGR03435 family)